MKVENIEKKEKTDRHSLPLPTVARNDHQATVLQQADSIETQHERSRMI